MVLKDFLAITGESGLFKFVAQGKNSIIVEHLETKKRSSIFDSAKVNMLEDIAVFTDGEDMPLTQVFNHIFDSTASVIDNKADNASLKKWFAEVLPEYDEDRVYVSDIKKVAQWYNTLLKLDLLVKEEPEENKEAEEEPAPEKPEAKTKKVSSPKNKTE
jgi:hypothetical protein